MISKHKTWYLVAVVFLCSIILLVVMRRSGDEGRRSLPQSTEADSTFKRPVTPRSGKTKPEFAPGLGSDFLTQQDEINILAKSNRSPRSLAALAWLGAPNAAQYLTEAFAAAPDDVMVCYAVLFADLDEDLPIKPAALDNFSRILPEESLPNILKALQAFSSKDPNAKSLLVKAIAAPKFSDFGVMMAGDATKCLLAAGWGVDQARISPLLGRPQSEGSTLARAVGELGFSLSHAIDGNTRVPLEDAITALQLTQKATLSGSLDINSQGGLRYLEQNIFSYLERFSPSELEGYFPDGGFAAAKEEAKTAYKSNEDIFMQGMNLEGVFNAASPSIRRELLWRIEREGDFAAFSWLRETNPALFKK
jgi:hypothetical protein